MAVPQLRWIPLLSLSALLNLWALPLFAQDLRLVDQVWQLVKQEFFDPGFNPNQWEAQRQHLLARTYQDDDQIYSAVQHALQSLGDPYTRLIDPRLAEMEDSFTGIGLHLGIDDQTQFLTTIAPLENSPAFDAGILPGDLITAIDGISTRGMAIEEAINRICGQAGTTVQLSLLRQEEVMQLSIERGKVALDPVRHQRIEAGDHRFGYIRLAYFSQGVPDQIKQAIQSLEAERVTGYVLDLRANPGGLVETSIEVARMWVDQGTITTLKDREGQADRIMATQSALTQKPLVVLVDQGTASASEILAAALRDHQRAILVGTRTFGKGSVQSIHSLRGGAGLAVTTARYLTPQGFSIDQEGITPDIEVPLSLFHTRQLATDRSRVASSSDPQFEMALQALKSTQVPLITGKTP